MDIQTIIPLAVTMVGVNAVVGIAIFYWGKARGRTGAMTNGTLVNFCGLFVLAIFAFLDPASRSAEVEAPGLAIVLFRIIVLLGGAHCMYMVWHSILAEIRVRRVTAVSINQDPK